MDTGKVNVVLVGHSMGGLAAREYMLNEEHWNSIEHHVAKLVTVGTPHWGSNLEATLGGFWDNLLASNGPFPPPQSEAVRDLKNRYDDLTQNLNPGVSNANSINETVAVILDSRRQLQWHYEEILGLLEII